MADQPTTSANLGPPPSIDVQDPLPEAAWLWRRVMTFVCVVPAVAVNIAVAIFIFKLGDPKSLLALGKWNIGFAGLSILLYLAGANASEIVKLLQSSKLLAQGVIMQRKATAENEDGKVTATSTAGMPSQSGSGDASDENSAPRAPESPISPTAPDGAPSARNGDSAIPDYAQP